ncbi:hypothetical protein HPB48_004576 [Haemaphysalis longicornis]|uniref:Uncharacterized protein n=1 Tax=Haemaphysalis longicornis TaxID=44386 RepID=A0A9J6FGD6_HAELO|nr:hypothetical protein HPB48_004576 [Haemaphysalis longicornis]
MVGQRNTPPLGASGDLKEMVRSRTDSPKTVSKWVAEAAFRDPALLATDSGYNALPFCPPNNGPFAAASSGASATNPPRRRQLSRNAPEDTEVTGPALRFPALPRFCRA